MLKYRIWTAVVLLLAIVAMIWLFKPLDFAIAIAIFFVIGAVELAELIGFTRTWRMVYLLFVLLGLYIVYFLPVLPVFYLALVVWLWATAAVCSYQHNSGLLGLQHSWVKAVCGWLMLLACWRGIVLLQAASPWWLITVFGVCWLMDTGAYFAGRRWGRHALATRISPKKTWEGFWGGFY